MWDMANITGQLSAITRRVREREIRRQILYNRVRRAIIEPHYAESSGQGHVPSLLPEFFKMMAGSLLGLWIIARLLAYIPHAGPLYTLPLLGLIYSLQATYYKHKLSLNPDYKIPKCGCRGARNDNSEMVLRSKKSAIPGVPNSVFGALLYSTLLVLVCTKHTDIAMQFAVVAVLVSAYLCYVMVARIGGLCAMCINVASLNLLILWQFFH